MAKVWKSGKNWQTQMGTMGTNMSDTVQSFQVFSKVEDTRTGQTLSLGSVL